MLRGASAPLLNDRICAKAMDDRAGFVTLLRTAELLKETALDVDLYIVVEYGISVSVACNAIVEVVRYKLESMTGVKVRKVNISVEGIRVQ